jgi:hypothetical protein
MTRELRKREIEEAKNLLRNDCLLQAVAIVKKATGLNLNEAYALVQAFPEYEALRQRQERLRQLAATMFVHSVGSTIH